jgi:hypothetical protein
VRRTRDGQAQVGYSVAGRSRGRMTLYAVCTVYEETRSTYFLIEPQNQGRRFINGLASKPLGRFLPVWPQNWWRLFLPVWPQNRWWRIFRLRPQNWQLRFGDLGLKITVTVSWFGPQNQVGYGLSVAPQNRPEDEDGTRHASRSSGLLHVEASRDRVSQFASKLAEMRQRVVHVAPSWRFC